MAPVLLQPYRYAAPAGAGYSAEVLADTPNAYYRLGEPSGTTMNDSSGNARHGTYSGSPALGTASLLTSDADTAVGFNGTGGMYGNVAVASWQAPTNFTVEARIKPAAVSGLRCIASAYGQSTSSWFLIGNGNQIQFSVVGVSSADTVGGTISAGTTYTVTGTYNTSTRAQKLYINGSLVASGTGPTSVNVPVNSPLRIGHLGDASSWPYNGVVDEFSLTPTDLSAARILARHNAAIA